MLLLWCYKCLMLLLGLRMKFYLGFHFFVIYWSKLKATYKYLLKVHHVQQTFFWQSPLTIAGFSESIFLIAVVLFSIIKPKHLATVLQEILAISYSRCERLKTSSYFRSIIESKLCLMTLPTLWKYLIKLLLQMVFPSNTNFESETILTFLFFIAHNFAN